jgi:hypothetical protein
MKDIFRIQCPNCGTIVDCPREHVYTNNRLCCMCCNKAFDISSLAEQEKSKEEQDKKLDEKLKNEDFGTYNEEEELDGDWFNSSFGRY